MADINQVQLPDGSQYNITDTTSGYATQSYVQSAISGITKATIGLGNVDNTSDANKPVSTAQQTALDAKTNTSVIAYTETSTTATKRYEIGDQFILNGVLYTATAIIANGGTITVGTNASASDTVTTQIDLVKSGVSAKANKVDLTDISETGSTASQAISAGTYFYLDGTLVRAKTAIASGATFTLNTNYEIPTSGALNDVVNIASYFTGVGSATLYGGHIVQVTGTAPKAGGTVGTVSAPFIPVGTIVGSGNAVTGADGGKWARIVIDTNGNIGCTVSAAFTYNIPYTLMYLV